MTDIIIYVAASGIGLSDRDSQGHTSPNLHAIERNQTESRLPYGITSTATTAPASMLTTTYAADQEVE